MVSVKQMEYHCTKERGKTHQKLQWRSLPGISRARNEIEISIQHVRPPKATQPITAIFVWRHSDLFPLQRVANGHAPPD